MRKATTIPLSTLQTPAERREERSFRRGFHQALSHALDAMADGMTPEEFGLWLVRVRAWRESDADITPPPEPRT